MNFINNSNLSEISTIYINIVKKLDESLQNNDKLPRKSSEKSVEARQAGNLLYCSKNHNKKIHTEILSLYTKSIAFAEENSEEMALGYGNRSALLMHLKKYKECLIDIEKTCQITMSDELKKKLATRKQDCLLQLSKVNEVDKKPPVIKFEPSKEIPCASKLVTLEYNKKYGRHVVAAQDIQPGTVIVIEKAVVLSPKVENPHYHCSHCITVAWNGIPCQSCTVAVYCSEECKIEAWQQYHDIECSVLSYFLSLVNSFMDNCLIGTYITSIRLFIKFIKSEGLAMILKKADAVDKNKHRLLLNGFFHDKIFQCNNFQSIYNLSEQQYQFEPNSFFFKIIDLLYKRTTIFDDFSKSKTIDQNCLQVLSKLLAKLKSIVASNLQIIQAEGTLYEQEMAEQIQESFFGSSITIFPNLFNHSCIENVNMLFTQNQETLLFTTKFVGKGEQLFMNYGIDVLMDKKQRQFILQNYPFNFVCSCQACEEDWSLLNLRPQIPSSTDVSKIYSLCKEAQIQSSDILYGYFSTSLSDEATFRDAIKIMSLIYKYHTGEKAEAYVYHCVQYIIDYFSVLYRIKNDMPNRC